MRKKICFCTTTSGSVKSFLVDLAKYMTEKDSYDVTFICDVDETINEYCNEHIRYIPIKMKRGISLDGLRVICQMYKIFKREKYDMVQYSTPNASLYASIASRMAGVRIRLYAQWGVRYIDFKGLARKAYRALVKIMCNNATSIEVESRSILEFSIKDGLYVPEKACVIWNGSACGVNLERYDMTQKAEWREEYRKKYGIPNDARVFGYCGRITRDKGLNELFAAFKQVLKEGYDNVYLMIIGAYDNVSSISPELLSWAEQNEHIIFTGFTKEVNQHYSALDVFCSLSYREGFGLVVIEAAAMGVPGIVTDCPGQRDTHEDGKTGISVPTRNVDKVVDAMKKCIVDIAFVEQLGENARKAVEEKYEQQELFRRITSHRNELIVQTNG